MPVVLSLHGYGQDAAQQDSYTGLPAAAQASGVLLVTPEGAGHRWNFVRRPQVGPDDVLFLSELLRDVMSRQCGDPRRLVITGVSDGADMAATFGCGLGLRAAWVISVAASVSPDPCLTPPAQVLVIHGRGDPVVPYGGGGGDRAAPFQQTEAQPVDDRMAWWAARLGCGRATQQPARVDVTRTAWVCARGRDLQLLTVANGGHTWPGAQPRPELGDTTTSLDATTLVIAAAQDPPLAVDRYLRAS